MDYPKLLKAYREKMFMSQEDLAQKLGISYVTVNRWENGKFEPTIKMKKKLYRMFERAGLIKD